MTLSISKNLPKAITSGMDVQFDPSAFLRTC